MADVDWSSYGACDTCGSVAGWPCHRPGYGTKALKNPHKGRPMTGREPYAGPVVTAQGPVTMVTDSFLPEPSMLAAGGAAGAWVDGLQDAEALAVEAAERCTCPDPMVCPECLHDPDCPEGEDPRTWCDCRAGEACTEPSLCRQRAHDPKWHPAPYVGPKTDLPTPEPLAHAERGYEVDSGGAMHVPHRLGLDGVSVYAVAQSQAHREVARRIADHQEYVVALDNAERLPSNPSGKKRVDSEIPLEIERDRYDRPELVRAVLVNGAWQVSPTGEIEGYTRASTLGNALEDGTGLNRWRGGMVVYGMSRRKDLVLAAQAIPGTDDKKLHRRPLYEISDQALSAAEASSAATVGSALHALTEQVDAGTLAVDIGEYQPVLDIYLERMTGWKVVKSETFVVSDYFHAAGSFDRLITPLEPMALVDQGTGEIIAVIMPGDLVVVDLKTSTTADYFGAKFFAQLAVYVTGSEYCRDKESPNYGRRTPLGQRTDFALILHIPQGGDADGQAQADWHWLDMRVGVALAQLACVNLETRKKRFTRTHMRPVLAQPIDPVTELPSRPRTDQPAGAIPERDPLGDDHLAGLAPMIEAARSFPEAEADAVDAELLEDGAMPEQRTPAPSALIGTNLGDQLGQMSEDTDQGQWITEALAGRDPEAVIAGNEPGDAELIDALEAEALPYDVPLPGGAHKGDDYDAEHQEEAAVPGPEETAPLPDGWESRDEQAITANATTEVPKGLGRQLQDAAARHAVEDKLIRQIARALDTGAILDLYNRASAAGYWSDRVKAAASNRKAQLKAMG